MNKRVLPSSTARPYRFRETTSVPARCHGKEEEAPVDSEHFAAKQVEREQQAFEKGREEGMAEVRESAQKEVEAALHRVVCALNELTQLKTRILQSCEKEVVALAIEIARKLVQREINLDSKITAALVRVALEKLNRNEPVTVFVSPDDLPVLEEEWKQSRASNCRGELIFKSRPDLKRGDFVFESQFGTIEGQMETRFREIEESLLAGF